MHVIISSARGLGKKSFVSLLGLPFASMNELRITIRLPETEVS
jgi:hypothetical protein